jgi:anti-sigma factor RsiW
MSDPVSNPQPHDEAEMLLPWYATGQLEPSDRLLVERHLSSCADCREQLGLERRLVHEFRGYAPEVDAGWARLRRRMEPGHSERKSGARTKRRGWSIARHPAVAGLAAAQLALLVIGGSWFLSMSRPNYQALGSAPAPANADLIIIFRPEATEEDLRSTLRSANASIVEGPTDANAYLLHVPSEQRRQSLDRLQKDHDVQMAQPIDGALQ